MKVTLKTLRAECPSWTWTAERYGFGWQYKGRKDDKLVTVFAVSILVGEDEFETQWRVDDNNTSTEYVSWWLSNEADL